MSGESSGQRLTSPMTCRQVWSGFAMDGSGSIHFTSGDAILTGDALSLFPFSVSQSDYGAKVEVART